MHKNPYTKFLLALIIFLISIAAYYYPVYKKGYSAGADFQNLMEARNFAVGGTYKIENSIGVLLSSENASQFGMEKGISNSLTPIIYGHVFKYFGFKPNLPLYISIALFSFFNVLIFLLSARLFGTVVGFMSGIAGAFMPIMAVGAIHGGFYEWGILFFGLALWSYLGSKNGPFCAGKTRILTASIFFALAALSRNAFAISFVPFFLCDLFINRSYKRSLIFLAPFIILFGLTLTAYSWLGVSNGYTADIENMPSDLIGEFFRDPYTYYFDKDNFIKEMYDRGLGRVAASFATQWDYKVSFSERLSAYFDSFRFYITETINLTNTGGSVVFGLMLLGLCSLYRSNKKILELFALWWILWLGYLVNGKTGNWDHFMEIVFIFSTLTGLGLHRLVEIIGTGTPKKTVTGLIVFIIFVSHLSYANKWKMHDIYRSSKEEIVLDVKNKMSGWNDPGGVYAVGIHPVSVYSLNYKIDHDVVYFDPKTIEKLISDKKLKEAFGAYNIGAVLGYDEDLTNKIKSQVSVRSVP